LLHISDTDIKFLFLHHNMLLMICWHFSQAEKRTVCLCYLKSQKLWLQCKKRCMCFNNRSPSTAWNWKQMFLETGNVLQRKRGGKPPGFEESVWTAYLRNARKPICQESREVQSPMSKKHK